jgi:hypothetical protein
VYKIQQAGISFITVKLDESKKDCKSVTDSRIFPGARVIPSKSYYTKMTMPELWQNCSDCCVPQITDTAQGCWLFLPLN